MDLRERYEGCPYVETCLISRCVEADGACWRHLRMIELGEGETLFHQGSPVAGCYVLCRGRVKLAYQRGMRTFVLEIIGPGQLLGEEAFCDGHYRTCAKTLERSTVVHLKGAQLRSLMQDHPEINLWLLETLARRCKAFYDRTVEVTQGQAKERLIRLLRTLEKTYGSAIPLSQAELAQMLGVGRDTINRCLQELERNGHLTAERRKIRLRSSSSES